MGVNNYVLDTDQDGASGPLAQNGASLAPFVLMEHTLVYFSLAMHPFLNVCHC